MTRAALRSAAHAAPETQREGARAPEAVRPTPRSAPLRSVLTAPGRPLPPAVRRAMGVRFGHDFSAVRVHDGPRAARAAASLRAEAFALGRRVVFAPGRYAPGTPAGERLLAHELAHTVQQRGVDPALDAAPRVAGPVERAEREARTAARRAVAGERVAAASLTPLPAPVVQRVGVGEWLARFFGGGSFDEAELLAYLRTLRERGRPEGHVDSDNKARTIVRAWRTGDSPFVLTPTTIAMMILEMVAGFTGDDDEQAILELLERSPNDALRRIFELVPVRRLNRAVDGAEWDHLQDFYRRRFGGGMAALLAGRVEPTGAPVPLGADLESVRRPRRATDASRPGERVRESACSIDDPAACHAFEDWIELFAGLPTFQARSGHRVIGPAAAPRATATDPGALASQRRPRLAHGSDPYLESDRFIDGPTDAWVRAHLPPELVEVAYQLPSDCADMAVILRHVWLVAHHRTEQYRGWTCGAELAETRSRDIQSLIRSEVYSGNVDRIVRPYTGPDGQPIRSFQALQPLLHPGDVLVWNHNDPERHRGHTQTVTRITRTPQGAVTRIQALQGNQPVGRAAAEQFRRDDPTAPSVATLRAAPGRRIEVSTLSGEMLRDVNDVWTWSNGTTTLTAAGPPAVATQPAVRRGRAGQDVVRGLEDWHAELRGATSIAELQSGIEAALLEARGLLEGGHPGSLTEPEARAFGRIAGERLWHLAKSSARAGLARTPRAGLRPTLGAEELGASSHDRPLRHVRALIAVLAEGTNLAGVRRRTLQQRFRVLGEAFERAARGLTGADFTRRGLAADVEVANVLVTGFDPFRFDDQGRQVTPEAGDWNPAGAAALQLDGTTERVTPRLRAAVEGAVFPVRFDAFRHGMVESLVRPLLPAVDGVITVSMDPGIAPAERPEIERYAVGIHRLNDGVYESIPATPVSVPAPPARPASEDPRGAAILRARGDLRQLAGAGGVAFGHDPGAEGAPPPLPVDARVRLDFGTPAEADRFLRAVGRDPEGSSSVDADLATLTGRMRDVERDVQGAGIAFRIDRHAFQARILRGPGGRFLSNEVFFRVLRAVAAHEAGGGPSRGPVALHLHTPRGTAESQERIPQPVATAEQREARRAAIATGRGVLERLLRVLRALIATVARGARQRRAEARQRRQARGASASREGRGER